MSAERNLIIIRRLLNRDGIKLWLKPFTQEDDSYGHYTLDFIEKYSTEAKLNASDVKDILEQLRNNALTKIISNKKFQESGIATLKLKITRSQSMSKELSMCSVEMPLTALGRSLKEKTSSLLNIDPSSLKLISSGAVISDEKSLETQKIKTNSTLLVLVIADGAEPHEKDEPEYQQQKQVQNIKKDVKLLLDSKHDFSRLEFADQNGKAITIPEDQKQTLGVAMTLNEKGQCFLKKKDYANALVYLLEADKEFMNVKWDFLNMIDNYPILCLDIVWCYLCLSSISDLHDAEKRLGTCEKYLNQSYGTNCDRLITIKGSSGCEAALFARLHLLQGILNFHQNKLAEAENYLKQARVEISSLKVDNDKISEIVTLGYSTKEARLSLRHCNGNVPLAVSYIINKKEEREQIRQKEREERKRKKEAKRLGKTLNGEPVSFECYNSMLNMGFSPKAATSALRKANNSVSLAVELLNENPNLVVDQVVEPKILEEMVTNLCDVFGLDYASALAVLENNNMNFELVKNILLNSDVGGESSSFMEDLQKDNNGDLDEETMEAVSRLASEIDFDEEGYLDLGLEEETKFLQHYIALLNNINVK